MPGGCQSLLKALEGRPLAVGVEASSWQLYDEGVYSSSNCGLMLDHAVVLMGANLNKSYWTVKNSWGSNWGEDGYIRLAMGNTCGVCLYSTYPQL